MTAKRLVIVLGALAYRGGQRVSRVLAVLTGRGERPVPRVVLTYHAVTAADRPGFERQMRALKRMVIPVFADEPECAGRSTVAVTFDDAFQCVFDEALPILARYEIPATVFVPTGSLGREASWMTAGSGTTRVVGREQLGAVDRRRVRLGSHTVTHPRLGEIERSQVQAELADSRRCLEQLGGEPVTMLALPYGSSSPHVMTIAAATGYARVFANIPVAATGDALLVGRVDASPNDWALEFRLKIQGAYQWLALAIRAKRQAYGLARAVLRAVRRRPAVPQMVEAQRRGANEARTSWPS